MAKKISQLTTITEIDETVYVPVIKGTGPAVDDYKITPANFIKAETEARIDADAALQSDIDNNYTYLHGMTYNETLNRITADNSLRSDLDDEITDRAAGDNALRSIFEHSNTETYFVFDGDSRTDDQKPGGYPTTMTPYPNILMTLSNFVDKGVKVNLADWGEDIYQCYTGYESTVVNYKPNGTTIKDAYLFVMVGINDITWGNDNLPTLQDKIDKYIAYCTRATADGFKVVALTSFYTVFGTSQTESDRLKFNAAIINNSPNVFLTIDTDMLMGKDTSSIYWADGIHQSHAGSRLIADYINAQFSPGNKMRSFTTQGGIHQIKVVDNEVRIGDGDNNVAILANGSLKLNGTATVFDDLTSDITRTKTVGTRVTINENENTVDFTSQATLSDYIYLNYQLSHKWKVGSVLYPHIHFFQNSSIIPNFLIQYRWQIQGSTKATTWVNYKTDVLAFPYTTGTINNIVHNSGILSGMGVGLSDILQFRIIRDTANASGLFSGADTYSGSVQITGVDIHYEIDSLGSNTEYTK